MKPTKKPTSSTKTSSTTKPAATTAAATNKGPLTSNTGKHYVPSKEPDKTNQASIVMISTKLKNRPSSTNRLPA